MKIFLLKRDIKRGVVIFGLVVFLFSGCALTMKNVSWPNQKSGAQWYKPGFIYSFEEATSILKGMSAGASINGVNISSARADKFTFSAVLKWQEIYKDKEYVPNYGGFFIGWDYVPVYGGSYQTNTTTLNKEKNISVDFKNISDITINNNVLYISGLKTAVITCRTGAEVQKYADAFYSMMSMHGLKLPASYGFTFSDINKDQEKDINKKGVVVYAVYSGSPADRAELEPRDIIYEANGIEVKSTADVVAALKGSKKTAKLKVYHWTKDPVDPYTVKWEKRLITMKPVER